MAKSEQEQLQERIIVTERSEYHLQGDLCVRVRERITGRWQEGHWAQGSQFLGFIVPEGATVPSRSGQLPTLGSAVIFGKKDTREWLLTSPVVDLRPVEASVTPGPIEVDTPRHIDIS